MRTSDRGPANACTVRGFIGSAAASLSKKNTYSSRAFVYDVLSRYDHDVPSMRVGLPIDTS